jgi:hypothetical protein
MSVVCPQCESGVRIEQAPPAAAPTGGACWSHQLESLLARASVGTRFVLVVARHEASLFERVSEQLLDEPRVSVVLDRRRGDPRDAALAWPRRERRRPRPGAEESRGPITLVAVSPAAPAVEFAWVAPAPSVPSAPRSRGVPAWLAEAHARYRTRKARLTARLRSLTL